MRIPKYILVVFFFISLGYSQVCCSLVGSVSGSSSALSNWDIQWPSPLDFNRKANWVIGAKLGKQYNGDLNIKYGLNSTVYSEFSNYIFPNTIGYITGSFNISKISEQISFDQTETNINQVNLDLGFRHYINNKIGFVNGSLHIPLMTEFSNADFLFKTNAVSSVSATWIKTFLVSGTIINQRLSLQLSASKNLKEDPQVYIDDNYNLNLSTPFELFSQLSFSPNINTNYYKLLAPLSPYDSERQERWLGTTSLGFDITPVNDKISWLHFNGSIPLFYWASEIGFPDGTQPTPSFSITMVKKLVN
jgi:hypothetical protein